MGKWANPGGTAIPGQPVTRLEQAPSPHPLTIVHFFPVFGCLGDSAWNCLPTVYSVVMGLSFVSNQDFSAKGGVKGVCVWGSACDPSRG